MTESEMQAELERLRAENAQLKSKGKGGLTLKVSEKAALSVRHGPVPVRNSYQSVILVVRAHFDCESTSPFGSREWNLATTSALGVQMPSSL
jgi:hypothetical protein